MDSRGEAASLASTVVAPAGLESCGGMVPAPATSSAAGCAPPDERDGLDCRAGGWLWERHRRIGSQVDGAESEDGQSLADCTCFGPEDAAAAARLVDTDDDNQPRQKPGSRLGGWPIVMDRDPQGTRSGPDAPTGSRPSGDQVVEEATRRSSSHRLDRLRDDHARLGCERMETARRRASAG